MAVVREAIRARGMLGMYAGILPRLAGIVPMRTLFWGTQSTVRAALEEPQFGHVSELSKGMVVGVSAGVAQTVLDNPIEVVKTRLMLAPPGSNVTAWSAIREGHFPGFSATMTRNVVFAVIFCSLMGLSRHGEERSSSLRQFGVGAVAGCVSSFATQPLD